MNSLYGRGDYVQLYKSSKKSMGKIRSLMIYDRNKYMSERIVQLSQEKSSFFAVGAAHLAGDKGLISLLKKQGFKLRHIPLH
ncbi:MAG: TraB/GumN family protein [Saprospiraceae bacterium]|nr:TraB/GumN family protein [Saprospiraceae bacterium]